MGESLEREGRGNCGMVIILGKRRNNNKKTKIILPTIISFIGRG